MDFSLGNHRMLTLLAVLLLKLTIFIDQTEGFACFMSCEGFKCQREYMMKVGKCYESSHACSFLSKKSFIKRSCMNKYTALCTLKLLGKCHSLSELSLIQLQMKECEDQMYAENNIMEGTTGDPFIARKKREDNDAAATEPPKSSPTEPPAEGVAATATAEEENQEENEEMLSTTTPKPKKIKQDEKQCICMTELCNDESFGMENIASIIELKSSLIVSSVFASLATTRVLPP